MVNPLIHDWWQQHETLDDKAARAVDLVCIRGLSRIAAAQEVGLSETVFRRRLHKWGIDEWVPKGPGGPGLSKPRSGEAIGPKPRTWKALGQPPLFLWPFQKAKGMLWRGATEEEAAAAVGAPLAALQEGLAVSMAWCLATGRCPWCEILLDHAEDREGEMCGFCARVLRGEPLLPGDYAPDVRGEKRWITRCGWLT